jgi:hypothetical protein
MDPKLVRGSQQQDIAILAAQDQVEMGEDVAAEDTQVARRGAREGGELPFDFGLSSIVAGQFYNSLDYNESAPAADPFDGHTFRRRDGTEMQLPEEVRTEDGAVGTGIDQEISGDQGPVDSLHVGPDDGAFHLILTDLPLTDDAHKIETLARW